MLPLVKEIPYQNPLKIFNYFAQQPWAIFFDSAQISKLGRYSFIALDPFLTLRSKDSAVYLNAKKINGNPFVVLQQQLQRFTLERLPNLPPFQGGAAGYLGYDLAQHLEKIPQAKQNDLNFPDLALGFYDLVLAFDHLEQKTWIVSSGFPETTKKSQLAKAKTRSEWLLQQLDYVAALPVLTPLALNNTITANFSREQYQTTIKKIIDYIYAGDAYQVNLSQRFTAQLPKNTPAFTLYRHLREINPAPFAGYFNAEAIVIASASPERFLELSQRKIKTRPIKGTRPRGTHAVEDAAFALELQHSQKDQAENLMIVDLLRNDLSRVCQHNTVKVKELCKLESYATVHHLVSTIEGELQANKTAVDLLQATFPGGSITGAPKIRAMEIIAELEPTARGPYCGSLCYLGFNGDMDSSILIRTYNIQADRVTFQVGGAIVADSDPAQEYEETLVKAKALLAALGAK